MHKLIIYPDDILKKVAEPVTIFDEDLENIVNEMYEIMKKENGIGLAAPQIGLSKRLFVTEIEGIKLTLINPEISYSQGSVAVEEGCLSFPGVTVKVDRSNVITISFNDLKGKKIKKTVSGLASICFQHELDHLNGKTFIDYLSPTTQSFIIRKLERMKNGRA